MKAKPFCMFHKVNATIIANTILIVQTNLQEYLCVITTCTARMEFGPETRWIKLIHAQFAIVVVQSDRSLWKFYRSEEKIAIRTSILGVACRHENQHDDGKKNPSPLPANSALYHRR
mmetsp:Transcript_6376/g.9694  ORF Transcript_6376/g.9694 Transcript_6376/m.9694 type:complete len:117 (-) Transcript_6376:223-573(-)